MNGQITKLAAAAVILIAAAIAVATFNTPDVTPVATEPGNDITQIQAADDTSQDEIEFVAESDDILDAQLRQVEQLFAAGDTAGLIDMLSTGEYEAKVAAADYLAQLADIDAVTPLENLAARYGETDNPFTAAAEQVKASAESGSAAEPNEPQQTEATAMVSEGLEIFELLPAETLFCVRINYFDYALGQMDQYLSGVMPVPMPATMGGRSMVSQILADASLANVDTSADFAIAGLSVEKDPNNQSMKDLLIVMLVPMKDYDKFIAENQNASAPDVNGISVIRIGKKSTLITELGGFGLATLLGDYEKLTCGVDLLAGDNPRLAASLAPDDLAQAEKQLFWTYANVQKASTIFAPAARQKLEQLKQIVAQQKSAPPEAINIYAVMLDIITYEVETLSLGIEPTDNLLRINFDAVAVPNTPLARMFTTGTEAKKQNELLGYLPEGGLFNVALRLNTPFWEELSLTNYDLISLMSDKEVPAETFEKLQKLFAQMVASSDGDSVMSWTIQPDSNAIPFAATWVAEINDVPKWQQANEEIMKLWGQSTFGDIYADSFDICTEYKATPAVDNHRGVQVDAMTFSISPTDPNSEYAKMIQNIYGQGLDYRWAYTDGLYLCSIGADCQKGIRDLIDKTKDGVDSQPKPEIAAAMQLLANYEECDFTGTYNHVRVLNMVRVFMPPEISSALTELDEFSSNSNLAFGGKIGTGRMSLEFALPKEHLIEMATVADAMNKAIIQHQREQALNAAEPDSEPNTPQQ